MAAWLHFLQGVDEAGKPYQINDPLAAELAALQARAATQADEIARVATLCAFAPVFGALGEDRRFIEAVARHTASLRERGVLATLESLP